MKKIIKAMSALSLVSLLFAANVTPASAISQSSVDNYRVRIANSSSTITVRMNSAYKVKIDNVDISYKIGNSEVLGVSMNNSTLTLKKENGDVIGSGSVIDIVKDNNNYEYFELKESGGYAKYPGSVRFVLNSDKKSINCVNVLDIETYIKGVIPHEMGANSPLEALKAQAITARSLAVSRVNKYDSDGYDVRNDTSDQVYKGYNATYNASTHNVSKAVDQTKGIVLKYGNSIVTGLFYSNNGGMTISDDYVWSTGNKTPYYNSKADTYDTAPHSSTVGWAKLSYEVTYTAKELRDMIINNSKDYSGYYKGNYMTPAFSSLGENFRVTIEKDVNGYVTLSKITDSNGREYLVKNYANRWVYGLRSQQYKMTAKTYLSVKSADSTVSMNNVFVKSDASTVWADNTSLFVKGEGDVVREVYPETYTFTGKGYGHGIGMSQNGAMNRAEAGHTYSQILDFYYTGCKTASNYGN